MTIYDGQAIDTGTTYRVKSEYIDLWSNDPDFTRNPVVSSEEVHRLAVEWGKPLASLLEQLEENET